MTAGPVITIGRTGVLSLEEQWRKAETLGRVEVDHPTGGPAYRVRIRFELRGSIIWATGEDLDIGVALGRAIEEAERLGRS